MPLTDQLLAHWPLAANHRNHTRHELSAVARAVKFETRAGRPAAVFNGIDSSIEVADHPSLHLGDRDFSIALWLHTASSADGGDIVGDLVSKFDPTARRGFNLLVATQTGVTQTTQPNYRHLHFGIDQAQADAEWTDCGRLGNALKISALATANGSLYAGTMENAPDHYGHLWRYQADHHWTDLGAAPPKCNAIESITWFDGALYCGTGRYNTNGSVMGDPRNQAPGGVIFRIEPDGRWVDCGTPGAQGAVPEHVPTKGFFSDKADDAVCLTAFRGQLFAVNHHRRGIHVYQGGKEWKCVGPDLRIMSITIHQGHMYALINDAAGGVYRYEGGSNWTWCGAPQRSTQTYCALTYQGQLYVGTWPECEIVRYDGGENWTVIGRIGYEREVMGAAVYNGKCYFSTLPMANVFRMDGSRFTFFGNLDNDPTAYLRRVWSMAIHNGQLFGGTLPGGRVLRRQVGRMATHDHSFPTGWRHVAAVRSHDRLKLYIDGAPVASSAAFTPSQFNLDNSAPLRLGAGIGHALNAALRDVRLYQAALDEAQIRTLAATP